MTQKTTCMENLDIAQRIQKYIHLKEIVQNQLKHTLLKRKQSFFQLLKYVMKFL